MRVAAYTRVSTEEQTKGYSLESQLSQIKQLCETRGWEFVKEYSDAGESGATMERPALMEMLDDSERKMFELILVINIDRLSRELSDMWPIIRRLRDHGVGLATTPIPDITSLSKEFYLAYGGMAGMTQYFRENLKEIQRRGIDIAKGKGKHLGRRPNGFYVGEDGRLHPDELGRKAIELIRINPNISLKVLATELSLKNQSASFKIKQSCLKYQKQMSG